ncbi:MAG: MFS transporter [Marinilabiliaceae bacterium]|nr:MFS transporter [Marinilabiliaceae bacterium]
MGQQKRNPWTWVASLYFSEGMPYVMVNLVSVIMYKRLGISNADIALYTSLFNLPWIIKPFWSPFVEVVKTKRWWIVSMQLLIGVCFGLVAFSITSDMFFRYTLLFFWLIAFSSATHDIAADGFYMIGLRDDQQSFFVGIRSLFYRIAMITGQGGVVILAGYFERTTNDVIWAWSISFFGLAILFILLFIYHQFILPHPVDDDDRMYTKGVFSDFVRTFVSFFEKKQVWIAILFFLFFRLGEGMLTKMAAPFLLDEFKVGGLGLSTEEVGWIYGTFGLVFLIFGGILGGFFASLKGLRFWIFWMTLAMNLPDLVYVYLSWIQPESIEIITGCIAIEQFGYGFGFTAFMLYMIYFAEGEFKTAHFAFSTGLMALGMLIPGLVSGWIQELVGYKSFFIIVTICTIPGFVILPFLKIDAEFGKKK